MDTKESKNLLEEEKSNKKVISKQSKKRKINEISDEKKVKNDQEESKNEKTIKICNICFDNIPDKAGVIECGHRFCLKCI